MRRTALLAGPGPSARSSAPSHLILAGRSHNGQQLTWIDDRLVGLPLASGSYPTRAFQGLTASRMLGVLAYGSPPTEGSAHWTMPRLPKSSMCWSSYPISRRRGLVCWPIWAECGRVQASGRIRPTRRNGGTCRQTDAPPQRSAHSPWRGDGPHKTLPPTLRRPGHSRCPP